MVSFRSLEYSAAGVRAWAPPSPFDIAAFAADSLGAQVPHHGANCAAGATAFSDRPVPAIARKNLPKGKK